MYESSLEVFVRVNIVHRVYHLVVFESLRVALGIGTGRSHANWRGGSSGSYAAQACGTQVVGQIFVVLLGVIISKNKITLGSH